MAAPSIANFKKSNTKSLKIREERERLLDEREQRIMWEEERIAHEREEASRVLQELERKRLEMDMSSDQLKEAAWEVHKSKFPTLFTKRIMVSRHFATDKDIIVVEGRHRNQEAEQTAAVKVQYRTLPPPKSANVRSSTTAGGTRGGRQETGRLKAGNYEARGGTALSWGGGGYHHNALRPRTVFSPQKPFSRALESAGRADDPHHFMRHSTGSIMGSRERSSSPDRFVISHTPDPFQGRASLERVQNHGAHEGAYSQGAYSQGAYIPGALDHLRVGTASASPHRDSLTASPSRGQTASAHLRELTASPTRGDAAEVEGLVGASMHVMRKGKQAGGLGLGEISPSWSARKWSERAGL